MDNETKNDTENTEHSSSTESLTSTETTSEIETPTESGPATPASAATPVSPAPKLKSGVNFLTPLAVVIGFAMIAGVLYLNGQQPAPGGQANAPTTQEPNEAARASYADIATNLGIDADALASCMEDEAVRGVVENDVTTARSLGAGGTPFSMVLFADGTQEPIPGALPYAQWMSILEKGTGDEAGALSPSREEDRLVYGDPNAPVTIVEFSDFECPYCARLHPTLKQIVEESGGGINWEYRHLPLPSHRTAAQAALVGECVHKLGSNELFWKYSQVIFAD